MVQVGREPDAFKPLHTIGPGAYEIRVCDESGAFRVIDVAKLEDAVYVLHVFQKQSQETPKADIDLAAQRYTAIGEQ
jgi:phage-related protein